MSDSPPIKVNRTIFKHVKPKNDPDLQLKEIREAHRKKWEQERQAEGSGLQQESSSARDGPGGTARSSEGPQGESANGSRKRKAVDSESDEIEFVSQAKKPKTKVVEAPRSLFATVPVLPRASSKPSYAAKLDGAARRFPTPRLLLTRTPGRSRDSGSSADINNTISFEEIMGPDKGRGLGLKSAWFYAFFIAQEEFTDHLPLHTPGIDLYVGRDINQDPLAHSLRGLRQDLGIPTREENGNKPLTAQDHKLLVSACQEDYAKLLGESYHACYPPMADSGGKFTGCQHSKFGMLVMDSFLRVFITSSNFMSLDFVYSDNHWFVVDLPLLPAPRKKGEPTPEFEQELIEHATLLGCPSSFVKTVFGKYDYSSIEDRGINFVSSVPGSHSGEAASMYGALRLRDVVAPLVKGHPDVSMEICTASIGGMQHDWLQSMYHAFTGGQYDNEGSDGIPEQFRITFPTRSDVEAARTFSREGASQMGCHAKWPETNSTIKKMFYHYKSKDQSEGSLELGEDGAGCLFHQKLYMAMPDGTKVTDNATRPLWIYIGSANFTKAAWGQIFLDKRKQKSSPGLRRLAQGNNFEAGVVVPGNQIEGMLEPGSSWQDLIPHERKGAAYTNKEKPYNSEVWAMQKADSAAL